MPVSQWRLRGALALILSVTVIVPGCDASDAFAVERLTVRGRAERGSTIRVVGAVGALDSGVAGLRIEPADAGEVSGDRIRLTRTGRVMLSALAADGRALAISLDVTPPPVIFFDAAEPGGRDVYSVALDGGELVRWTSSPGDDMEPTAAGGALVFSTTRHGAPELYGIAIASRQERRITSSAAGETQPALSRDARLLAFTSDGSGVPRIWIASGDGANAQRLTAPAFGFGGSIESDASLSGDGLRLVLTASASGRATLYTSPSVAGSVPVAIPVPGAAATDVEGAWNADGTRIAFISTRGGGSSLFLFDISASSLTRVDVACPCGQPDFLVDGRIVFTRYTGSESSINWFDPAGPGGSVQTIPLALSRPQHPAASR